MSDGKTYTRDEVKDMLDKSMQAFRSSMVGLVRECAGHASYRDLWGSVALNKVADKLESLK